MCPASTFKVELSKVTRCIVPSDTFYIFQVHTGLKIFNLKRNDSPTFSKQAENIFRIINSGIISI